MLDVTIVGAGFCGTLTAIQLLRTARKPMHIRLVEKTPSQAGRGIAYSTTECSHLLNTPAGRMSAIPEDPDHFVRWAAARNEQINGRESCNAITRDAYLPRKSYGDYLSALLRDTATRLGHHTFELVFDEAVKLDFPTENTVDVHAASGMQWRSDACVLALGNAAPLTPAAWGTNALPADRYHGNPWDAGVIPRLLQSDSCLLAGSGLTMLDVVMALDDHNYCGTVHVVSRRGLIPLAHAPADHVQGRPFPTEAMRETPSLRALVRQLRALSRNAGHADADWQAVVDALRSVTPSIWQGLGATQQRRFLRHARPYWDHHRHRVARVVRQRFDRLTAAGRVRVHVGRMTSTKYHAGAASPIEVLVRTLKNTAQSLRVDQVVNCTGPGTQQASRNGALLHALLRSHPAAGDSQGLGVAVNTDMRVALGDISPRVFALGPPVKGQLWESTAVPECRLFVERIVASLTDASHR